MGLKVWSRREFFSKKINIKKMGRFNPPPIKTKVENKKKHKIDRFGWQPSLNIRKQDVVC